MTAIAANTAAPRLRRRAKIWLAVLAVLVIGWLGYFAKFGECDFHSKFCVVSIAGTRSELGVEWQTWNAYISTSGDDPATHTLF